MDIIFIIDVQEWINTSHKQAVYYTPMGFEVDIRLLKYALSQIDKIGFSFFSEEQLLTLNN